jgi:hypothetical protein
MKEFALAVVLGHPRWRDLEGRFPAARPVEQGRQRCLGRRQPWRWSSRRSVPAAGVVGDSEAALLVRLVQAHVDPGPVLLVE